MSNIKKQAAPTRRQVKTSVIAGRVLIFTAVLAAVMVAVMSLQKGSVAAVLTFHNTVRPVMIAVTAVLTAASVALWIARRRHGTDESEMILPASLLTILSGGLCAASVAYALLSPTRFMICLIVTVAIYYIYIFYSRTFFSYAAVTLVGGLLLSFIRFGGGLVGLILPAILVAALEVILLLALIGGRGWFGKYIPAGQRERIPFLLTAALLPVGLVLGLAVPSLLFYAIVLLFASFLVIAIINTLQMM